jgi:hypothetical protein
VEWASVLRGAVVNGEVLERFIGVLSATVQDHGEAIITDYLRPAHKAVLDAGKRALKACRGLSVEAETEEVALASQEQRDAVVELRELGRRYSRLQHARQLLKRVGLTAAHDDRFGEFVNLDELWLRAGYLGGSDTPPWPTTSAEGKFEWILTSSAQPWMPTPAQRDQRYEQWVESNKAAAKRAGVRSAQAS